MDENTPPKNEKAPKKKRGFGSMDPEKQKLIAGLGGRTAHELGRAYEFNSETGKVAGQKGGVSTSQKPGHMSKIGKLGGASLKGTTRKKDKDNVPE